MLRVGIIGTGNISGTHIAGYLTFPEACEVVALANPDREKAEARRAEFGLSQARVYADAAGMLAAEELDLVSITSPPGQHAALAVGALKAGVNVLVEKPMAPSLAECDAMLAASDAAGKLLSVVAQNRFRDDFATLREALESGLIGRLSHVQVNSLWSRGPSYYDLAWRGAWSLEGGGCTLNQAIHHLDLVLWLLGRPLSVTAVLTNVQHDNSEVEDLSVAILSCGRTLVEITSSVVHHGEEQGIVIQGEFARISQPWRVAADLHQPNGFPAGPDTELVNRLEALAAGRKPLAQTGHTGQIGDVLKAIAEGRRPAVDGQDGRNAIELVTAIYKSGIERQTVALPLAADDPYYQTGGVAARAPHFFEKTSWVDHLEGTITIGGSDNRP